MVIERRHEMLRYGHKAWRDKLFSLAAVLGLLVICIDMAYFYMATTRSDLTEAVKSLMYDSKSFSRPMTGIILLASPLISYVLALSCSEILLMLPQIISIYGGFVLLIVDLSLFLCTLWIWDNNGFAIATSFLAVCFSFTFYLGREVTLWVNIVKQAGKSTGFLKVRAWPTLVAAFIDTSFTVHMSFTILCGYSVLKDSRLSQIHSIAAVLAIWMFHSSCQFVLRGSLMAHYINDFFLKGTQHHRPHPVLRAFMRLMTSSFGTVFLASGYYAARNSAIYCGILAYMFRMGDSPNPGSFLEAAGIVMSNLLIVHLACSQRFRSLFQIVAYGYSFTESLMLTEVYPSLKIDLLNKLTCTCAFVVATITGSISYFLLNWSAGMQPNDTIRIAFLVSTQAYMVAQLVFEPVRSASFTLAVGLVEDPKYLIQRLPWLKSYYPSFT